MEIYPFVLGVYLVLAFKFRSLIHFKFIFIGVRQRSISLFECGYWDIPAPFLERKIFFPLNGLVTFVKNQLTVDVWVYLQTLNSILLYLYVCYTSTTLFFYYHSHGLIFFLFFKVDIIILYWFQVYRTGVRYLYNL